MLPSFIPSDLLLAQYSLAGKHLEIPAYWLDTDYHIIAAFNLPTKSEEITTIAAVATGDTTYNKLLKRPAAQIVVASIVEAFGKISNDDISSILKKGTENASQRIAPLETSVVCAAIVIKNRKLYIVNVGHCRIFLARDNKVRQISITHTLEEKLIEDGLVRPEEIEHSPTAGNSLYQFLGYDEFGKPDFRLRLRDDESDEQALANQGLELKSNDRIVVCSSGVFRYWKSPRRWQLFEEYFLRATENIQETVEQFVHAARDQGAFHALTVIMLQIP